MPLTPQEYLEWWLTTGRDPLEELADKDTLGCGPQHVGFEQTVQRRLRAFDNDVDLKEALRLHVEQLASRHTSDSSSSNPRNKLRELTLTAFKKPEDGGLDPESAMEGISELNIMELRRRRLVAETPLTFKPNHPAYGSAAMIQELNKKATEKFGLFYLGFRASVSLDPKSSSSLPALTGHLSADDRRRVEASESYGQAFCGAHGFFECSLPSS